jgi:hypothetical protein
LAALAASVATARAASSSSASQVSALHGSIVGAAVILSAMCLVCLVVRDVSAGQHTPTSPPLHHVPSALLLTGHFLGLWVLLPASCSAVQCRNMSRMHGMRMLSPTCQACWLQTLRGISPLLLRCCLQALLSLGPRTALTLLLPAPRLSC